MSLKDEIEKLVRAERAKLESRDRKHSDFYARQRERFAPLQRVLQELSASVDERYLRATIREDSAHIEVGRDEAQYFSPDVKWRIEPNYDISVSAEPSESLFIDQPGFRVSETQYYRAPDSGTCERNHVFDDEKAVTEYIVKGVAEQIATYEHMASLRKKT